MTIDEQRSNFARLVDGVIEVPISATTPGNPLDGTGLNSGTQLLRDVRDGKASAGAVLLYGPGKNFCAGGNVAAFASHDDRSGFVRTVADGFHEFVRVLTASGLPIVAGVQGWAAGAGMSLVTHCDVTYGSEATHLTPAYLGIGFTPDGGMTWTLPRIVGTARAREMILTSAVIDGAEAHRLGLLSKLVPADEVTTTARATAVRLAAGPRSSVQAAKTLLVQSPSATLDEQLDAEAASVSTAAGSPAGREGVDAFVAKRAPDWASVNTR